MANKKQVKKRPSSVLGANLRNWRRAYGESLEDVAEALNLARSTVASHETGEREPSKDTLTAYANHFMIPVEILMHGSPVEIKTNLNSASFFKKNIGVFFPIFEYEPALYNEHYKRACRFHKEMYERAKQEDKNAFYNIDNCIDEYIAASEDSTIEEAVAANLIAILLFCVQGFVNAIEAMEKKPAILRQLAKSDESAEEMLYDLDPEMRQDFQEAVKEVRTQEFKELITELLVSLKQSADWSDLADYYIAIQYLLNIVDNTLTSNMNRIIGTEMLDAFEALGNKYARKLNKTIIQLNKL